MFKYKKLTIVLYVLICRFRFILHMWKQNHIGLFLKQQQLPFLFELIVASLLSNIFIKSYCASILKLLRPEKK